MDDEIKEDIIDIMPDIKDERIATVQKSKVGQEDRKSVV